MFWMNRGLLRAFHFAFHYPKIDILIDINHWTGTRETRSEKKKKKIERIHIESININFIRAPKNLPMRSMKWRKTVCFFFLIPSISSIHTLPFEFKVSDFYLWWMDTLYSLFIHEYHSWNKQTMCPLELEQIINFRFRSFKFGCWKWF